jgi:hypothetical protein
MQFPEDDEMNLEQELSQAEDSMDMMSRDFRQMGERRNHLRKQIAKRQLDPAVAKIVELAQNAGHALGANEALANRIKFLERRIEVRDKELDRTSDRDEWKARAEAAELKLKRKRK